MRWLDKSRLRFRSLFRRSSVEQELSDEIRFHFEKLTEEKVAQGMSAQEARYGALRELGGVAGALLAYWGAGVPAALVAAKAPPNVRLDLAVLGFALGVSLLTVLLSGLAPALRAARVDVVAVGTTVALLACYIPARRATKVDPTVALRYE